MNKFRIFEITEDQLETLEIMRTYNVPKILINRQRNVVDELLNDCREALNEGILQTELAEYDVPLVSAYLKKVLTNN